MYSPAKLAFKYLHFYLTASNGKGHGVHSPFVFEFITKVLNDTTEYDCYKKIEQLRHQLQQNHTVIELQDFGAGSGVNASYKRKISDITAHSLKPKKFAQLLFRVARFYECLNILELGTCFGVTSAYLASANSNSKVITLEGASAAAEIARRNFNQLHLTNIEIVEGNFDYLLPSVIGEMPVIDFAFIDGNHRKEPTLRYFQQILTKTKESSILVFDDIHWSKEMEAAWEVIKTHASVTLSIDLFFIGIVFFRKEQKVKQHFVIRF